MLQIVKPDEIDSVIDKDLGASEWMVIDQERIDKFADATMDHQFIHVDPEMAKATPWGTTISHGFLTLSLLTYLQADIGYMPEGLQMAINYGADKVRFMEAVPVNSKIRGRFVLAEVNYKKNGRWLTKTTCTIEIEGKEKPAAVVEALTLYVVSE